MEHDNIQRIDPQFDSRSVDELISAALSEPDEDLAWDAVVSLHWRGTAEVLRRSEILCQSECPQERELGANILGQLGVPDRSFPDHCSRSLMSMLAGEHDGDVLQSIFVAFSHLHTPSVIPVAAKYIDHADADVRHAVVLALTGYDDELAIDCLIHLTNDIDVDVRDWATFALGTQVATDNEQVRDALAARLFDQDDDTRGEAMIGLARRRDQRAIAAIKHDLDTCASLKAIEAAEIFGSPDLLAPLVALREQADVPSRVIDPAIAACSHHGFSS